MHDTTLLVIRLMGPVYLVVGLGFLLSKDYYKGMVTTMRNENMAMLLAGMVAMIIGLLLVMNHNYWSTLPEILVSLLGWGSLVKGGIILLKPNAFDGMLKYFMSDKVLGVSGVIVGVLGLYFMVVGYFI